MATDLFISVPKRRAFPEMDPQALTYGTSSTAADYIELRMQTDTGSGATGLTRRDVIVALELFAKAINEGGKVGDGSDVPAPV